jgi:multidrug transporter EmrE-like cation transporter
LDGVQTVRPIEPRQQSVAGIMVKSDKTVTNILERQPAGSLGGRRFIAVQWFPIGLVLLSAILTTFAEVLLKIGATQLPATSLPAPISFVSAIFNVWVILGIVAYIGTLALWLTALPRMPLHLAYGLSSSVHLLVPLACWLVLHEIIPVGRMVGMLFIFAGIVMLAFSHE